MNEILLVLILAAYIASGVCQPVLIELLAYNGMCEKNTMLYVLPNYIGMSLSFLMNFRNSCRQGKIQWTTIIILSSVDIISQYLNFSGLVNAGSLIFTVIYSSVTVYTAIFSCVFLNRQLHSMQWIAVFLIMLGLIFGGRGAAQLGGEDVWLGVIQIFIGSMFHSLTYILSEFLLKNATDPIAPEMLSTLMGLSGVIVFGVWQVIYTIPNFQVLIVDSIASKHGSINVIIFTVIILTLVNFIHAICFFNLLEIVGSTTTGTDYHYYHPHHHYRHRCHYYYHYYHHYYHYHHRCHYDYHHHHHYYHHNNNIIIIMINNYRSLERCSISLGIWN